MGVSLKSTSAEFSISNILGKRFPVSSGLIFANYAGDTSGKNLKIQGVSLTTVGAPTQIDDYSTNFSALNYISTNTVFNADAGTFILVARINKQASSQACLVGTWPLGRGVSIINVLAGTSQALWMVGKTTKSDGTTANLSAIMDTTNVSTETDPAKAPYALLVGRWWKDSSGLLQLKLENKTNSLTATATGASGQYNTAAQSTDYIGIGSSSASTASSGGNSNVQALSMYYSRALTDAEVASMYSYIQSYYSDRGITV